MPFGSAEAPLHSTDPTAYLPHRYPFLMLDRVIAVDPGISAQAETVVTNQRGAFPQILLVECIAQLVGIAANHHEGEGGFLAGIDQTIFHGTAHPGDRLLISATIIKSFGRLCMAEGTVECNGTRLAETRITLGIGQL